MSGDPGAKTYRISIKSEVDGTGSSFLHDQVHIGDVLEVSAPRGTFTLQPGDSPVVLASAGIGATPVLAMFHALVAADSQREVWWLYGARNGNQHPFARESRELLKLLIRDRGHFVYSKPEAEDQLGRNYDSAGHLDVSVLDQLGVTRDAEFYLCGPSSFLRSFSQGLKSWAVNPTRVRFEVFGPEDSIAPGQKPHRPPAAHLPSGVSGPGPQISFTRSGLNVPWSPRFLSLLELAEACDVPVRWSCRTGVCHTCESILIGGTVAYEPYPLEPPADGNLLICCSQPSTDVEIDL